VKPIPERQDLLDKFIAKYFPEPAREPGTNGHAEPPTPLLSDDEVLELCRKAHNAAKFAGLFYDGDTSGYGGDDSAADCALVGILAFYTADGDQLDRLFRRSALMRPKWDERRGATTYGQRTIEYVNTSTKERYSSRKQSSPSPSPYRDSDAVTIAPVQLSKLQPPRGKRPYLIEGVVPERFPTVFYGDGGTAKTTTVLHLTQSVVRGASEWLGHKINRCTDALFIDFELDLEEQLRRAYEVAHGLGYTAPPDGLHYLNAAGHRAREVFDHALDFCKGCGIELVIVDSLGVAMEGDAELSRDVLQFVREVLDPFRAERITPLIVDHQSKLQSGERYQSKTMFGSVYKANTVRSMFQVEVRERYEAGLKLTLRHKKTNFGALLDPFGARISWEHNKTTLSRDELSHGDLAEEGTMNVSDRILHALAEGPAYPEDLAAAVVASHRTVKSRLTELRKAGKVEDTGEVRNRSHEVRLKLSSHRHSYISDGDGDDSNAERVEEAF
jgi:DNA-binding transcriptional ArsR family regulator